MSLKYGVFLSPTPYFTSDESRVPPTYVEGLMSCYKSFLDWTHCFLQLWLGVGASGLCGGFQPGRGHRECRGGWSCQTFTGALADPLCSI